MPSDILGGSHSTDDRRRSLRTRREPDSSVATESESVGTGLDAAGFEDAAEIGRGGFGVVYRCTQESLDRTVAVKVLTTDSDPDNRARFVREQQAMGRLTGHPNIVTVLAEGVTDAGRPYLVTPYYPLGSLEGWIRRHGPLPAEDVLQIGVKIAGALESAHRLDVVHRDVKPGNILLTDYGEPALTDFGIAHIAGGFQTAAGTVTGSPAFTAPEVLEGEPPTPGADVYGLGATMFCALTGHAAFERRSGEKMVTQFLRIATQPPPDLRDQGVATDISALVESAMNRDSGRRPSASALGEEIRQVQQRHGYPVGDMALQNGSDTDTPVEKPRRPPQRRPVGGDRTGNLPLELTSLVDRRSEAAEVKNLLSTSRLVTVAGIGGVGKTRLALRAATQVKRDFADGVWLIDLTDVSERAILIDIVAATVGVRDESSRPLFDVLVEFLCPREILLVLDNCEQLVAAVAELDEALLQACPGLRILVTSREPLNIPGEAVLRLAPLTVPDPGREPAAGVAPLRRGDPVRRAGRGGGTGIRTRRRQQGRGGSDLCQAGRFTSRDRTGGRANAHHVAAADLGADGYRQSAAHPVPPDRPDAAADPAIVHGLELRPVHAGRTAAVGTAVGVRREL